MHLTAKDVATIRERIHNLDCTDADDRLEYEAFRLQSLRALGRWCKSGVRDDATGLLITSERPARGNVMVGVGFNEPQRRRAYRMAQSFL